jgi:hypothetical protein
MKRINKTFDSRIRIGLWNSRWQIEPSVWASLEYSLRSRLGLYGARESTSKLWWLLNVSLERRMRRIR